MVNKLQQLYESNLEMILCRGEPWSRYIAYRDIIKIPNDEKLLKVRNEIIYDSRIKAVYQKLYDIQLGVYSITNLPASHKVYGSYFWGLRFLADIGITLSLDEVVRQILIHQSPDGQFIRAYYRINKTPVTAVCLTANLVYSLAMLGYLNSRGIQAAMNYILTTQRKDGGWHCDVHKQIGERDEDFPSCPSANVNVIRALAIYKDRYQHFLKQAIEQIFSHWENRHTNYRQCDFGIGTTFMKFRYPPHYWGYDILNVLDTISFYPDLCQNNVFDEMIQQVVSKWDGKNFFKSEKSISEWYKFDFAIKNRYSCWISCLICRILRRVYFR